jgi:molybdopterin-guanine dinucleotide biosynthesis protein A
MSSRQSGLTAGYILAGGASRRMGQDKALLEGSGGPLLGRLSRIVAAAAGGCTVVAPAGRYEGLGVPVLSDLWPGEGPLGGILTVLENTSALWNLIVAVDMPLLDAEFLARLLAEARQGREALVPAHPDGSLEPLCAVYPSTAITGIRHFFAGGGRRVKDALCEIEYRTTPAPAGLLLNVNTPEQWEAAKV